MAPSENAVVDVNIHYLRSSRGRIKYDSFILANVSFYLELHRSSLARQSLRGFVGSGKENAIRHGQTGPTFAGGRRSVSRMVDLALPAL